MEASIWPIAAGLALFVIGFSGAALGEAPLRKILALNIMGSGVFLVLIAAGDRGGAAFDPVPHALVLTGIVVAVSATAVALALLRRLPPDAGGPDADGPPE